MALTYSRGVHNRFALVVSQRMTATDYKHAKLGCFTQNAPVLTNPFLTDPILPRLLKALLPQERFKVVSDDLAKFGTRIVNEVDKLGFEAETNEPELQQFDGWGNRIDKLIVTPAWYKLKAVLAEEGLVGIGYDPKVDSEHRRIHQMAKIFMFHPASGLVSCPLAMTDGAAKTFVSLGFKNPATKEAFDRLTSRDPSIAWTSGQWMTEKAGGSDVAGGCDTYAKPVSDDKHLLYGYKWFSSAVDADVTLTLARTVDDQGSAQSGTRGLSLFFAHVRKPGSEALNGIQMIKLKNKIGTRQLPTAELLLDGVEALKISEEGRGVASIANMLNVTRIHNALASASSMRRIISLARDYSTRRTAFGKLLQQWPLHVSVLAQLETQARAGLLLTMEAARLLGIQEGSRANEQDALLLRIITPIVKLHVGKVCVPAVSEGVEAFGGQGYIEDTGIPGILRDAQVTAIWEGTTNVLSLDILRVFARTNYTALDAFRGRIIQLSKVEGTNTKLLEASKGVQKALTSFLSTLKESQQLSGFPQILQRGARDIGISMGNIYSAALLTWFAALPEAHATDIEVAHRYATEQPLNVLSPKSFDVSRDTVDQDIVFENFFANKL